MRMVCYATWISDGGVDAPDGTPTGKGALQFVFVHGHSAFSRRYFVIDSRARWAGHGSISIPSLLGLITK